MMTRKLLPLLILIIALYTLVACQPVPDLSKRIQILPNEFFQAVSEPKFVVQNLNNPMSPHLINDGIVFSESGTGEVKKVSLRDGKVTHLITGFGKDNFAGYDISVQGITIDPLTNLWIVCAAEGKGHVFVFNPDKFPTDVKLGREILLEGAVEDNPYAVVLAKNNRIIAVSSGTSKAYQGVFNQGDPLPLKPIFEVETGITGMAVDPISGDLFGAVFGASPGSGSIIRWHPTEETASFQTVASGFTNLIDVSFTSEGHLLALEFGGFEKESQGAISIVATDGSGKITPFIRGLSHPTGIYISSNHRLLITEFGSSGNGKEGSAISIDLAPSRQENSNLNKEDGDRSPIN